MKIGVFDSGVGGKSVAEAITKALPQVEILYRDDHEHVPYGTRTIEEIHELVLPILLAMQAEGCDIIVIACNTVTTNLIDELRRKLHVRLVGMEPMIKPAATMSESGVIAVCATPRTLASERYAYLKATYASGITILEPNCADWSSLIERNLMTEHHIRGEIEPLIAAGADVIVLGCTHYHWIEEDIRQIVAGRARVLQPEAPVITQLERLLVPTAR